jgi:hypothetical protein
MYKVIGIDQKIYGPISADQLRQWHAQGRINQATLVLAEGSTEWRPLASIPEFAVPPLVSLPPQCSVQHSNGMAVAGLIFGILGNLCCCFGVVCSVLGIIFSVIALSQHEAYPQQRGRGLAMAGLVLSILGLVWHCFLPFVFGALPHMLPWPRHWRYL